ncbi:24598_t:CDS:2, partial [Dentiscutata erythropus]
LEIHGTTIGRVLKRSSNKLEKNFIQKCSRAVRHLELENSLQEWKDITDRNEILSDQDIVNFTNHSDEPQDEEELDDSIEMHNYTHKEAQIYWI